MKRRAGNLALVFLSVITDSSFAEAPELVARAVLTDVICELECWAGA